MVMDGWWMDGWRLDLESVAAGPDHDVIPRLTLHNLEILRLGRRTGGWYQVLY